MFARGEGVIGTHLCVAENFSALIIAVQVACKAQAVNCVSCFTANTVVFSRCINTRPHIVNVLSTDKYNTVLCYNMLCYCFFVLVLLM